MEDAVSEFSEWHQAEPLIPPRIVQLDHRDRILDLNAFRRRCDEFNRLLPYARDPLVANPDIAGRSVQVNDTIDNINRLGAELERSMLALKESIRVVPAWYEAGNLLCKPVFRSLHATCSRINLDE